MNPWSVKVSLEMHYCSITNYDDRDLVVDIRKQRKAKHMHFGGLTTSSVMVLKGKCYRWRREKFKVD